VKKQLRRRKVTLDLPEIDLAAPESTDAELARICRAGMYPIDAPGMSLPGPDFLRHAQDLDDGSQLVSVTVEDKSKKSGKAKVQVLQPGVEIERLYLNALRRPGFVLPVAMRGGRNQPVTFVPGHVWGQYFAEYIDSLYSTDSSGRLNDSVSALAVDGPHPCDVMVLGKMPWTEEVEALRNMIGTSGQLLRTVLMALNIRGFGRWYVTNLLKFMPPDGSSTIKAAWLKDCRFLLDQELRIVKPKYILCLGADASKALLGTKNNVSYMDGRVVEYTYPVGLTRDDKTTHTACVMTVVHPAQVARDETQLRALERGCARFNLLTKGIRFDKEEQDVDHRTIRTLGDLEMLCLEIEHDPRKKDDIIAVDAEWHGEHPINSGAYLRTVQFAWLEKTACGVVLTAPGGQSTFTDGDGDPAIDKAMQLLSTFMCGGDYETEYGQEVRFRPKRVIGHFFNADLEWLVHYGLDLRKPFSVPLYDLDLSKASKKQRQYYEKLGFTDVVPAWVRTRREGGADTGLMAHAVEETASYKLETLAMRYTTVPRYDIPLHDWREAYCKENNLKSKSLEGYGMCPESILVPYGIYDADATLRLYYTLDKLLDCDYERNCCREPFWESMIAAPAVLEIHRTGITVDRDRIDFLTARFLEAREKQEQLIKQWARWPSFNIRSVQHVKEFLFGEDLNGKLTPSGQTIRIRPRKGQTYKDAEGKQAVYRHDARTLDLMPMIDTSKPPKQWAEVVMKGKEKESSPSTNKLVLSILAQESEDYSTQIGWIRDYRFLDQVLKTLLRPPVTDEAGDWVYDDDSPEHLSYDAGLASVLCDDGRVRTHIYQVKETGRWSSARPNLQNISKQRDPDYKRLLGDGYAYKLRSVLKAKEGCVLLEADYTGAELYGMAISAGDPNMIDHATRNQLPENDPRFYDIHSNVAKLAFRLPCEPTKKGLEAINKASLRIVAKAVIFGIAYGRGAKAIALAAKEQGVRVSVDDAQQVIDTIFNMYPRLLPFFEQCRERVRGERWMCHSFGRFRRFPQATEKGLISEFERQAMNFPIQGMIASAMSRAIAYLHDYKMRTDPTLFNILLQVHDALLLEVPFEHVRFVAEKVLPWAMREMVPIYPTDMTGVATGAGPYNLGAEAEVMLHWGETLTEKQANAIGLHDSYWSENGMSVHYFKPAKK
jgi:uracil-DNA glycosylase family 4